MTQKVEYCSNSKYKRNAYISRSVQRTYVPLPYSPLQTSWLLPATSALQPSLYTTQSLEASGTMLSFTTGK